jgi:hypothetical protein
MTAMRHVRDSYGGGAAKFFMEDISTNALAITGGGYGALEAHQRITRRFVGSIPNSAAHEAFWAANSDIMELRKDRAGLMSQLNTTICPDLRRSRLENLRILDAENRELLGFEAQRLDDTRDRTRMLRAKREALSKDNLVERKELDNQIAKIEKEFMWHYYQAVRKIG